MIRSNNLEHVYRFPIPVRWSGWDSDTYTLSRNGWAVFANGERAADWDGHFVHIALRDPMERLLIVGRVEISGIEMYQSRLRLVDKLRTTPVEMQAFRFTDRIIRHNWPEKQWVALDKALPCEGLMQVDIESPVSELSLFKYTDTAREIYLPPASVDECLNRILELQYPEQREIRDKIKQPGASPIIQARVYALAA